MTCDRFALPLLFGLFTCLAGCGDPEWGYVEGVVTLEGQRVGPGVLTFEPMGTERQNEPSAVGHVDDQGNYTLGGGKKKGAAVGAYRVTITGGDSDSFAEEMRTKAEATTLIPARYQDPESGLTANVVAGKQVINFELEKQSKRIKR